MITVQFGLPYDKPLALALGFYDGMHLGHRKLFDALIESAEAENCQRGITTFSDTPKRQESIYSYFERKRLYSECGAEICISISYARVCNMTGREFFCQLMKLYKIKHIFCGENHNFGCDGCDTDKLQEFCNEFGVKLTVIKLFDYEGVRVSSTAIKTLLKAGDVDTAKTLLKIPYHIRGEVVSGDGRGRNIGVPTANLELPYGTLEIKRGVYGTYTEIDGELYRSVTNYGARPTFMQSKFAIETNVLGYNGEPLNGKEIVVYFHKYIRPIRKYPSAEALVQRIKKDMEWTDL